MLLNKELKRLFQIYKLSKQAFGEYKLQVFILTSLGFISGILGGVGINAVIPMFSFFAGQKNESTDFISTYIKKFFLLLNIDFTLKYLLIFIVCVFILKAAVLIIFSYINIRITSRYEEKIRSKLFKATLGAEWPYLLKQKLGHLEVILRTNVENSKSLFIQISNIIMTLTSLVAYTLVAINISLYITLITFALGGALFFLFKPFIFRVRKVSYEWEEINRQLSHFINETILGLKTVKIMSINDKIIRVGKEYFSRMRKIIIKSHIYSIFTSSLMEPISIIFIAVIFTFSFKKPNFNFAALIAVVYLAKQIFIYITNLHQQLLSMNATVPFLKKVLDYEKQIFTNAENNSGKSNFKFNDKLEFRKVSFFYSEKQEILSDVSFEVKKGMIVGLIGPSGAGKTTIVDLILRLFNPASGEILLDNKPITEIDLDDWRKNIGYVSQDIFLMNDTIANNIKFYDDSIGQKEIEEAAKMANIYEFIMSCPNGFETVVGERGVLLSGGQRQRLIIARVLARKPQLLILDEATSALDNESEIKIQQVINGLKNKVTVLAIAHRLSTVINSDKLIVLENGRITEEGEPEELLKDKKSYFSKVYNLRK